MSTYHEYDGAGSPGVPMRQAAVLFVGPWRRGVLRRRTPGAMVRTCASDARALEMVLFLIHGLSVRLVFAGLGKRRRTSRRVCLPFATTSRITMEFHTTLYVVRAARGRLVTCGGSSQGNCNNL
jgi:hypothetical protein